jgi:hypothetical protein
MEIVLDSLILVIVLSKVLVFSCCTRWVSYGVQTIWIFAEIVLIQILCLINIRNWALNILGLLLCVGSTGVLQIWGTLHRQM